MKVSTWRSRKQKMDEENEEGKWRKITAIAQGWSTVG